LEATSKPSFRQLAEAADLNPALDFVGATLRNMDFRGEDLSGFNFRRADLSGSDFRNAITKGASFWGANLLGTIGLPKRDNLWRARKEMARAHWIEAIQFLGLALAETSPSDQDKLSTIERLSGIALTRLARYTDAEIVFGKALGHARSHRERLEILAALSDLFRRLGDMERLVETLNSALQLAKQIGDYVSVVEFSSQICSMCLDKRQYGKASECVEGLKQIIVKSSLVEEIYWNLRAEIEERKGNLSAAADIIKRLLSIHEKTNSRTLARDYGRLSELARLVGNHDQRAQWLAKKKEVLAAARLSETGRATPHRKTLVGGS
jgi:tetratricopeptide (TPR) repeat protein